MFFLGMAGGILSLIFKMVHDRTITLENVRECIFKGALGGLFGGIFKHAGSNFTKLFSSDMVKDMAKFAFEIVKAIYEIIWQLVEKHKVDEGIVLGKILKNLIKVAAN